MTVANETIQCSGGRSCSKTFFVSRSNKSHNIVISRLSYFSDSFGKLFVIVLKRNWATEASYVHTQLVTCEFYMKLCIIHVYMCMYRLDMYSLCVEWKAYTFL